ncbi:hypothetical protein C4553_01330 [Candidatus Parcubacteria bacterium]|nr:MAG: hypothetical protein C4553_01330 [Candidatus Parcubacteria bacterium]
MRIPFKRKIQRFGRIVVHNLESIVGIVLIWRGTWYLLDNIDEWLFGGSHFWTAILGIILGLVILFIPEHDHKDIDRRFV